ncbi:hypothetical protein PUR71_31885 [Streptomyces sp. SP17BM10]|uniref:hypothetical protein n=1 Tax=Streptomyces sp. SP17BM10 TaxID=3002530 RepID=UPI002E768EB2|nr:hypothetical protein [Streptomyces sp. SP17BM10]MEE1787470.1 hypothetical protein [Streptomyces sp. SP17BM10]
MALAVPARAADFAGLAAHGLFGGLTHREYLRLTEDLLRGLRRQGVEVHLRVMEAEDYADYCDAFGLDPGTAAARVAYAGDPELAGEPFVYAGEPLAELVPLLLEDHRARVRMSFACAVLLEAVGDDDAGQRRLVAVMRYATTVFVALAEGAGEGFHLLTLRCHGPEDGEQLTAAAELCVEAGMLFPGGRDTEAFCVTLAAGVAVAGDGALLLHGDGGPEGPPVRGWALVRGRLRPMSAHEVFDELADTVGRGVPFPRGVLPRPGFPLPPFPLPPFPGRSAPWEGPAGGGSGGPPLGDGPVGGTPPGEGPVGDGSPGDGSAGGGRAGERPDDGAEGGGEPLG